MAHFGGSDAFDDDEDDLEDDLDDDLHDKNSGVSRSASSSNSSRISYRCQSPPARIDAKAKEDLEIIDLENEEALTEETAGVGVLRHRLQEDLMDAEDQVVVVTTGGGTTTVLPRASSVHSSGREGSRETSRTPDTSHVSVVVIGGESVDPPSRGQSPLTLALPEIQDSSGISALGHQEVARRSPETSNRRSPRFSPSNSISPTSVVSVEEGFRAAGVKSPAASLEGQATKVSSQNSITIEGTTTEATDTEDHPNFREDDFSEEEDSGVIEDSTSRSAVASNGQLGADLELSPQDSPIKAQRHTVNSGPRFFFQLWSCRVDLTSYILRPDFQVPPQHHLAVQPASSAGLVTREPGSKKGAPEAEASPLSKPTQEEPLPEHQGHHHHLQPQQVQQHMYAKKTRRAISETAASPRRPGGTSYASAG